MKIADAHTHIFPHKIAEKASKSIGNFYGLDMSFPADVEILFQNERAISAERCLVCSAAVTPSQVTSINDFIAEQCRQASRTEVAPILIGLAAMHPEFDNPQDELDRAIELGLVGVKFHNDFQKFDIDDERAIPLYKEIAKRGMPILFHAGDDRYEYTTPSRIAHVLELVPELTVIASHFGGYLRWHELDCLPVCDRLYFDTSSSLAFLDRDDAMRIIERFGTDRFMFGTDFPMWDAKEELERFMKLPLSGSERDDILYNNFRRLFG